jgi:high-affinity iron transporter
MLKLFIIFFRETLEISIILGIIYSSTDRIKNRTIYITSGILLGVVGSLMIASFANTIFDSFSGYGQEITNASILLLCSSMIVWMIIWMKYAHKKTSSKIHEAWKGKSDIPLISLIFITAFAIFREGSEIVLFSYSVFVSTQDSIIQLSIGALSGFALASLTGFLLYKSIIKIPVKYLFKTTTILLSLIAAGMASQAANLLQSAEIMSWSQTPLWNSSCFISQESFIGNILGVVVGYVENPTGLEVAFYAAPLLVIYCMSSRLEKQSVQTI